MRAINKLTTLTIRRAKRRGMYADGAGLYLTVHRNGSRSWVLRFGRQGRRYLGLGPCHTVSLHEARERARAARLQILDGIDPIAAKRERKAAAAIDVAKLVTFAQCADRYFEAHRAGWRPKHAAEWRSTLKDYADPVLGSLPVQAVDVGLVLRALEPIWTKLPVTAGRVRQRIEAVLDWAKARGHRDGENPARWRGHLDHLLPAKSRVRKIKHHVALPCDQVSAFMAKLRDQDGTAARALELILLTATRMGEVLNATWSEVDLKTKTWTIPAGRMKAEREHRVPLSDAAVAVIERMAAVRHRDSDYIFPGSRRGKPVGESGILLLVKAISGDNAMTVHGLRSTFRDWAAERTNYPNHVVEMALAHTIADGVEAAYRRGDLFDKRRRLMDEWARYCAAPPLTSAVVPLRSRS
jgi:integrase